MSNVQDVVDSISTRTVTEERQNLVTKTVTNKFAVFGMIIGLIVMAAGALIGLGMVKNFPADSKIGYIMLVGGAFMLCYFGMNVRQEKIDVVTTKVEKQVPIEGPSYHELKLRDREELLDAKVNAMAAVFEKLAFLTSELEEKVIAQENLRLSMSNKEDDDKQSEKFAAAVVGALREERKANDEQRAKEDERRAQEEERRAKERAEENAKLIEGYAKREEELRNTRRELDQIEQSQKDERERLRRNQEEFEAKTREQNSLLDEKNREIAAERERMDLEKQKENERIADEKKKLAEEREVLAGEIRAEKEKLAKELEALNEDKRVVEEIKRAEEARKAEEARIAEEKRKAEEAAEAARIKAEEEAKAAIEREKRAEEERLRNLGLSAVSYAWSSNLRNDE